MWQALKQLLAASERISSAPPPGFEEWRKRYGSDTLMYQTMRLVKLDRIRAGRS